MSLFYHMERFRVPHKLRMSLFFSLNGKLHLTVGIR